MHKELNEIFFGKHFSRSKQRSTRKTYIVEDVDNGGMLAVFLSCDEGEVEVWRYKLNGELLKRGEITHLNNYKTLFMSFGGSYLRIYVALRVGNKIYFLMMTTLTSSNMSWFFLASYLFRLCRLCTVIN